MIRLFSLTDRLIAKSGGTNIGSGLKKPFPAAPGKYLLFSMLEILSDKSGLIATPSGTV
jgi:hypothetical protein